jgi:hypothetical protein
MIKIAGSALRSFTFAGELPVAYAYYADVGRLLSYLPHICLVRSYGPDRFRLLYSTTELGTYHVRIFADVETTLETRWVVRVRPMEGIPPVKAEATLGSATTQGYFSSQSIFSDNSAETQIKYALQLKADLPTPLGLRLMPGIMVDRIARSITNMRIREIADGFVERTTDAFPHWLAEMETQGGLGGQTESAH